jgi:hypothetical protein
MFLILFLSICCNQLIEEVFKTFLRLLHSIFQTLTLYEQESVLEGLFEVGISSKPQ